MYWLDAEAFRNARQTLRAAGYRVTSALLTPCQVLKASGSHVIYAGPELWNRICVRQGTWYRHSEKKGLTMMVSARRLPAELDDHLDAEIGPSDFRAEEMPSQDDLEELVASQEYSEAKPYNWEAIGLKDAVMFKTLFGVTGFWGRGDNLKRHWLGHRANHANFLAKQHTTEIDGEQVPYSVTGNEGVCSSCAEYFNVISPDSRKLVQACPGASIFGGAPRDTWTDVRPVQIGAPPSRP